jgi:HNH endonuclease
VDSRNDLPSPSLSWLSDEALLARVEELAGRERGATAQLIASLIELDVRKLYLGQGCPSLFVYCTEVLCLSEHAAYGRITACRAARLFPLILDLLADGSITLTTVCLLSAHLTPENHRELLESVRYKSRREVERMLAGRRQQGGTALADGHGPTIPPPEHYTLTLPDATHGKLLWARDLLRHTIPSGDLALVVDRALTVLIADLERAKSGTGSKPRSGRPLTTGSRHIPVSVRRAVWARDGGRCAFVGAKGRCSERGFLEFHHVIAFAAGGKTTVENLELRCRAHNVFEAEQVFGASFVREHSPVYGQLGSEPS